MAAPWLADALRAGGLPVVEEPGWQGRGTGGTFTPLGVLLHHTAGPRSGNLPSLGIVRNGRSDLQGPLAQLMLARDGVFHVIAAGRANHAGVGSARWVPNNDGNRYLVGIEAESCGLVDDWTDEQRANYPKGVAALCRAMDVSEANVLGHKEWAPTRKIDPAFWDMNAFRAAVRACLRGGAPAAPKTSKGLPDMIERKIVKGANYGRIVIPVGDVSGVVARAWVSLSVAGGGHVRVCFQKGADTNAAPPGAGPIWDEDLTNAERPWREIPNGTEFIEYWIDANGDGSLLVELLGK